MKVTGRRRAVVVRKFVLVALASCFSDILWTWTVVETSARHVLPAALLSVALVFVGGLITVQYVKTPRLLLAVALGSFCGTVVALLLL